MDQEMLLSLTKNSDSDEVEEYKLPPSRNKRLKSKKGITQETKIARPTNGSFLSWKCAIMFILMTSLVSGALILAFYIMNMQSEISYMKNEIGKVKEQMREESVKSSNNEKSSRLLQNKNQNIKRLQKQLQKLQVEVLMLNNTKTQGYVNTPDQLSHRIHLVESDIDMIKTSLAKTGSDMKKLNVGINENEDEIKLFGKLISYVKTQIKDMESKKDNDETTESKDKKEIDLASYATKHYVAVSNQLLKDDLDNQTRFTHSFVTLELSKLKSDIDFINRTQISKLEAVISSLSNNSSSYSNEGANEIVNSTLVQHDIKDIKIVTDLLKENIAKLNVSLNIVVGNDFTHKLPLLKEKLNILNSTITKIKQKKLLYNDKPSSSSSDLTVMSSRNYTMASHSTTQKIKNVNTAKFLTTLSSTIKQKKLLYNDKPSSSSSDLTVMSSRNYTMTSHSTTKKMKNLNTTKVLPTLSSTANDEALNAKERLVKKGTSDTPEKLENLTNTSQKSATSNNPHTYPLHYTGKVFEQKAKKESESDYPDFKTEDGAKSRGFWKVKEDLETPADEEGKTVKDDDESRDKD